MQTSSLRASQAFLPNTRAEARGQRFCKGESVGSRRLLNAHGGWSPVEWIIGWKAGRPAVVGGKVNRF